MKAQQLVGQHDMMLSQAVGEMRWVRTRVIQRGDSNIRALFLVACEVNDPNRFGYHGGAWWKLEQGDWEAAQPRRQTFRDELGSYTLVECASHDSEKLFYTSGTYWKREQ